MTDLMNLNCSLDEPNRDYYDIYRTRDGVNVYARRTMLERMRYVSTYGASPTIPWTYEPPEGAEII